MEFTGGSLETFGNVLCHEGVVEDDPCPDWKCAVFRVLGLAELLGIFVVGGGFFVVGGLQEPWDFVSAEEASHCCLLWKVSRCS